MNAPSGPQMLAGRIGDISICGQELNYTTWRLAKMNLVLRGIEANLGPHHGNTFHNDLQKDLKADFILANPPFSVSDWRGDPDAIHATSNGHCRGLGNMRGETK